MAALSKARVFWIRWCSLWAFFWAAFGIFTPVGWIGVPFSLLAILIPVGLNRSRPAAIAFGGPAQATGTPPGWYADPLQAGTFRWWDGWQWTAHTSLGAPGTSGYPPPNIPPELLPVQSD